MRRPRLAHGRRALVMFALVMLVSRASATVTQVDGTILPVINDVDDCDGNAGDDMQVCLDTLEGVTSTNDPNRVDAFLDAATVPELFLPNTTQAVQFKDISEGAGFENSFGWYNIGDDVLTAAGRAANLHPILGCGVPMVSGAGNNKTHSGNPSFYVQTAEPGATISVDFAQEQAAGRYKGGFIGFYLITPENNPAGCKLGDCGGTANCGDFKNNSSNKSLFGFIYFTQKDLNNDGDFVHHLVYSSKATADRFYFGFEDLFRGGDNDFEDMLIQVTGLTPPCAPQAEVCDGLDNDCDGLVDGADPDLSGVGAACSCDGVGLTCDNGPKAGQCQAGITACNDGEIVCHATGVPSGEVCDGLDNNCNVLVDDNPAGTGGACDGPDADLCPEGQIVCTAGGLGCSDNTGNNEEQCNGADDDCDGTIDEGNPGGGGSCGSSIGVCTPGTLVCEGGGLVCQGGTGPGDEVCNGLDDDCDGVPDDSPSDAGEACGVTGDGECELGQTICVGGSLSCAGEVGPATETCNALDDDCDGDIDDDPVDAGQPCGSSIGACEPGVFECSLGTLACTGGLGPVAEDCDGIDDDCDGKVDEEVPGEGEACGGGTGPCSGGVTKCISGAMQCVGGTSGGTETCNLIDDDCDGAVDEGDLCNGGVCDHGVCASPCLPGEFPCPSGKICDGQFCVDDPCFGVQCPADAMGNLQQCKDGVCAPLCDDIACPGDLVCRGSDGACVPDTCEYLPKCAADELCVDSQCVRNPCDGVTCPGDQFCRDGACVASCEGVQCAIGQACQDGACVETGCAIDCAADEVCNPTTHQCQPSACGPVQCTPAEVCDPLTGDCVPDPCQGVTCPTGQTCAAGQCGSPERGQFVTTGGGGGCAAGGGDGTLILALAIAALLVPRRLRRQARRATAAALLAGTLVSCGVNEYCLDCEKTGSAGSGGGDGGVTGDGGGSGGDGGGATCDPNMVRPEVCNHADDDCDGAVDEAIDLQGDELNCGACGVQCNKPGAQTLCVQGACEITGCFPGFNDDNGDITGPYAQSDGCEYQCFVSNGGVEACDTLDNDCDGATDEGLDLVSDVANCGACGKVCEFFQATPHCTAGTCGFDPATDCATGFVDANATQADGCEYECTPSNGGAEICDVQDNDCDGTVDEGFVFATDPNNCGRCGFQCQFANATASCTAGTCGFDPATDCAPGFVDADGKQVDGCEYACTPSNGGVEICDGTDNDCDGIADDNPSDAGIACASTSPALGVCVADGVLSCASGQLVCAGATPPTVETCDDADQDCDGAIDEGVSEVCYTGPQGTSGVGACHPGFATCSAGTFGACTAEVTPSDEQCNNRDDDCDGNLDEGAGGGPIVETCYGGPAGTAGVGTCQQGTQTCAFGGFGGCAGEVQPTDDVCGDGLDSDCDAKDDGAEGCLAEDPELRLDAPGGGLGEGTEHTQHSDNVVLARGTAGAVYAVWSQRVGGATEVYFRRSTDGGVTWGTIQNLTSGISASAVQPQVAVSAGSPDRVVVAYQTVSNGVRDIRVTTSADGGATFGATVGPLDGAGDSFHHVVAVRGQTVVVAWEKLDTSTLIRDVQSRVSIDGGATFRPEFRVNVDSPATRFAGRPQVGLTSAGGIVWAWREQRDGATRDIFAAAVASATATPTEDVRIDEDSLADATKQSRESDFPVLVVADTTAYLVWQDVSTKTGGGADVMFARSTSGGASWGGERVIDDPAAEVSSSFTPALAVDPGAAGTADDLVAIAWEDRRQGSQIFASVSRDGGVAFEDPVRASSQDGDVVSGQNTVPQLAAAGDGVLVVTYQNQLTNQNVHVFVASSIDGGATWTFTQDQLDTGGGNALAPRIAPTTVAGEPGAVIGWADFRGGAVNGDVYVAVSH